jgi:hypothetical protein
MTSHHTNGIPVATNGVHHETDEQLDTLYSWWPGTTPAPASCPEALFSCTVKGTLGGHETLLTVRGMTPEEFRRNLASIKGLLDEPSAQPASQTPAKPIAGWCNVHSVHMTLNSKEGRSWYSHRTADGQFCKGR